MHPLVGDKMSGYQKNGLPVEVQYFDTIGSHEWVDNSTWPAEDDSKWTLRPDAGLAIKLTEVMVVICEDAVMHEGGDLVVEFWIDGLPYPVKSYKYSSFRDWFARSFEKHSIPTRERTCSSSTFRFRSRRRSGAPPE